MRSLRAAWLRGGTSKGLFFQAKDLPPAGPERDALVLAALGSPDPSGLQLNGLGGGISSTSKVALVSPSARQGFDIDYLFGQVSIKERRIDWSGSCGNLSAAVGLFAQQEQLLGRSTSSNSRKVRVWQVNQSYEIIVHMPDEGAEAMELAGVAGREPPIYVELVQPCGEAPLLPSGNVVDMLPLPDGTACEATLVAAGNPTIFVRAACAKLKGSELPGEMDYSKVLPLVEHLRKQAAPLMGIEAHDALRVAFVSAPQDYTSSSGEAISPSSVCLLSRISTPGRIHHAHTGTGAIALACAARVEGSIPWQCLPAASRLPGNALRIGHPGGVMEVRADVAKSDSGSWHALGAGFLRTARYLMRGEVFVPPTARAP